MPERLPDLGLGIKGVELQPGRETSEIRERTSESIGERERRDMLSTSLCRQP